MYVAQHRSFDSQGTNGWKTSVLSPRQPKHDMHIDQQSSTNILIRSFTPELFARLQRAIERVQLERGQVIVTPEEEPSHIFFPEGGVCSIVASSTQDELPTEVGLFGREGVSGLGAVLGAGPTPFNTTVQIDCQTALRIDLARFREEMDADRNLRALIHRFIYVMMHQMAMTATGYAHRQLESRLARWLLMCCDRIDGDDLALTHEFMAQMLGARRSSVTVTLHVLEGMGAIRSERSLVNIRDREKLTELAGDTYGSAENEYRRLIGDFGPQSEAMAA